MEESYTSLKVPGQTFLIPDKYSLIKVIGHGAYGVVISAQNHEDDQKYAIKKIANAFENTEDAKRILREIILMRRFNHENIVKMVDLIPPPSGATSFEDIYIVQDLMETDLHRIIYSKQSLSVDHVKFFVYQILRGLKYLHSANVLHRDLKPGNLLVKSDCTLKICDFGLSRMIESGESGSIYVVTRWYRPPEILLNCRQYSGAIDVWSVGCIMAELLLRKPLFPGDDYIGQLKLIHEVIGTVPENDLEHITSERAKKFMYSLPRRTPMSMGQVFPTYRREDDLLDLAGRLLDFNPDRRITVDEALGHPFHASVRDPGSEIDAGFSFEDSFAFEDEDPATLSKDHIQDLIWEEIKAYHPRIPRLHP